MSIEPLEGVAIKELASGEELAVNGTEVCFVADVLPVTGDGRDLMFDQRGGFG